MPNPDDPAPDPITAPPRRQPVILNDPIRPTAQFAEAAGGTAAGCAAICCCCTCGLVNLLVLTVVRLPAGLCRKAVQKQRMKRRVAAAACKKKQAAPRVVVAGTVDEKVAVMSPAAAAAAAEMEREMWAEFCDRGFWRTPSQRDER